MKHLVIGAGEVGLAVFEVLQDCGDPVRLRDMQPVEVEADVLHICFPWSDTFAASVRGYIHEHIADLVVVHSTVPVGTCDPYGWVHSPVRGRHPHLVEGLRSFTKHFGGSRATEAAKAFDAVQIPTLLHSRAAETEAGKLWELIQYGVQIQVEKQIHAWCETNGVDFAVVYTQMAHTYNAGWQQLEHPEFVRPVLEHMPGPIGGHCVVKNSQLIDHPLARLVTE